MKLPTKNSNEKASVRIGLKKYRILKYYYKSSRYLEWGNFLKLRFKFGGEDFNNY